MKQLYNKKQVIEITLNNGKVLKSYTYYRMRYCELPDYECVENITLEKAIELNPLRIYFEFVFFERNRGKKVCVITQYGKDCIRVKDIKNIDVHRYYKPLSYNITFKQLSNELNVDEFLEYVHDSQHKIDIGDCLMKMAIGKE